MRILSVDTSCDDSSVAIFDSAKWQLCADVVLSHAKAMQHYGGIVPELASREHLKALPLAVDEALRTAALELTDIDWFTASNRPGLIGALLVGTSYIKGLAYALQKPFAFLDHLEGHLFSPLLGELEGERVPPFPWIGLVVSGGHTELFLVNGANTTQWLGGTLDDAAGEAFDKIGKLLGFPYPAGPAIDRFIHDHSHLEKGPYRFPIAKTEGYYFSFSGLKTAVGLERKKLKENLTTAELFSLVSSAQEAILEALAQKVRLAQKEFQISNVVVTGGVACNSRLRKLLPDAYFPKPKHCTDNAAMLALLAAHKLKLNSLFPNQFSETAEPCIQRNV